MKKINIEDIQTYLRETQFELKPTQGNICFPILERIINKINRGAKFGPIQVVNDFIVNGHHRYICYSFLKLPIETINWRRSHGKAPAGWDALVVEMDDWDSQEDIEKHENECFPPKEDVKPID